MKDISKLPPQFKNIKVMPYYEYLQSKKYSLIIKRCFDLAAAVIVMLLLLIPMGIIAIAVKIDSKGSVLFKQERVTTYGRHFKILKFRTMVQDTDNVGSLVTTKGDMRVTKLGKTLRKYRLDEFPQIFNVIKGDMTFVGVRPEVQKYVDRYEPEYYATLLLPAGITSPASLMYKDEEKLLESAADADYVYVNEILPEKMKYNLQYIESFGFFSDIKWMFKTVVGVVR